MRVIQPPCDIVESCMCGTNAVQVMTHTHTQTAVCALLQKEGGGIAQACKVVLPVDQTAEYT
eukprot:364955-Chlamydomonas_euryale.AAC.20